MEINYEISIWDIVGVIADIQTSYTDNFKALESIYDWKLPDARLQVLFNCCDLAANARLNIATLMFAKSNGLSNKEWWEKWCAYAPQAFSRISDFNLYVDDKCRQYTHRVQEQLLINSQIYMESFIRNLARKFGVDENKYWSLKKKFLVETLNFSQDELAPLDTLQYLKNTLHNKGIHYNKNNQNISFSINECVFNFIHSEPVMFGWSHIKVLLIANSNLLFNIINSEKVCNLLNFDEQNVVILNDD